MMMTSLRALRAVAWTLATVTAGAALAAPTNVREPLRPGTHKVLVDQRVSGVRRSYYVHVPVGHEGMTPLPVVVAIHGAFSTAREFERESGFSLLADRESFIVVYPQGIGLGDLFRHWNSGHCCGKARKNNIDDVGFVLATVDDVARRNPVDRARLYLVGFSNGGMLAYRIAAEHPEVIAAVAVVSGTIGGVPAANEPEWSVPRPKQPVPVLALHGRADIHVPYDGGRAVQSRGKSSAISVSRSIGMWVDADGCDPEPKVESIAGARVERQTWFGCHDSAEVVLYSIDGWGHEWPKSNLLDGFEAAATIWQFFERHWITPGQTAVAVGISKRVSQK
jgi:polyhydroxybutyrate depolymerase